MKRNSVPELPECFESPPEHGVFETVNSSLRHDGPDAATAWRWLDRIRRLVELNRGSFLRLAKERSWTQTETAAFAGRALHLLVEASRIDGGEDTHVPDLPSLNAALHLSEDRRAMALARRVTSARLEDAMRALAVSLDSLDGALERRRRPWVHESADSMLSATGDGGEAITAGERRWSGLSASASGPVEAGVVVLCPNRFSLYTNTMCEMLRKRGIPVSGVLVRSLLSLHRIRKELNFGIGRLVSKIYRKLILRSNETPVVEGYSMTSLASDVGAVHRSVFGWGREHDVPVVCVDSFNSQDAHRFLDRVRPDIGIFTGGGIVRTETLRRFTLGLFNAHPGILPQYRGMDVVRWPVLEGMPGLVGSTVYRMDAGLDTGMVCGQMRIDPTNFSTFSGFRNHLTATKAVFFVECLEGLLHDRRTLADQPTVGRQYFSVHPRLEPFVQPAFERLDSIER